jgi:hypothetical protein
MPETVKMKTVLVFCATFMDAKNLFGVHQIIFKFQFFLVIKFHTLCRKIKGFFPQSQFSSA